MLEHFWREAIMRGSYFFVAVLLAGAALPAQTKLGEAPASVGAVPSSDPKLTTRAKLGDSPIVLFAAPGSFGCPVSLIAERHSPSVLVTAGDRSAMRLNEGIQLGFGHQARPNIEQVTVVVHGLSGKDRLVPLAAGSNSDVEETFELTRPDEARGLDHAYLRLKTVRTTQWIELTRIDFADGSNWRPSRAARCTVTPDRLVLVSDR